MPTVVVLALLHLPSVLVLWDAFRLPEGAWRASGVPRPAWVVIQVVLGFVAAIVYLLIIRPKVVAQRP